jgi:hypothetical protein
MIEAGRPITTYRKEIRAGLLSLAAPVIVIGGWALIAPRSWYDNFPISSADWISGLGAYQEHLVRDFGALYLGLGLLLAFAGIVLDRLLVQTVLGASLVFQVPHLGLAITATLLVLTMRPAPRTATEPKTVEGGIRYGTR